MLAIIMSDMSSLEPLDWKGWAMIAIFILTFIELIREKRPNDITMLFSTGALLILGILTPKQFLGGFANDIILVIAMLCILARAIELHGIVEVVSNKLLSNSKHYLIRMLSLLVPVAVMSAFINNTPLVLLMTPVVTKWALKNNVSPSTYLIPLSYVTILGGACTLIGTSANVIVEGLIDKYEPKAELGFFELGIVGIPCAIVGIIYLIFAGKYLIPERIAAPSIQSEEIKRISINPWQMCIVIISLVGIIIASLLGAPLYVACTGGVLFLMLTRTISFHEAQKSIRWHILLLIGFSFAFGTALVNTNVAQHFAESVLKFSGNHPHAVIAGILFISMVGTEVLSNNAAALISFPIGLEMMELAGYDSVNAFKAVAVAVALGASFGFAIPTGYQCHMIVYEPGGYKFTDFIRTGVILDVIVFILLIIFIPVVWPFG